MRRKVPANSSARMASAMLYRRYDIPIGQIQENLAYRRPATQCARIRSWSGYRWDRNFLCVGGHCGYDIRFSGRLK